jgi:hypothetical protein
MKQVIYIYVCVCVCVCVVCRYKITVKFLDTFTGILTSEFEIKIKQRKKTESKERKKLKGLCPKNLTRL